MKELVCETCKSKFKVHSYRRNVAKYCSYPCYWKSLTGKNLSPKTQFKKGQINPKTVEASKKRVGSLNHFFGKHHTTDSRAKITNALLGKQCGKVS